MLHITEQGQPTQKVGQVVGQGEQLQPRLVVLEGAAGKGGIDVCRQFGGIGKPRVSLSSQNYGRHLFHLFSLLVGRITSGALCNQCVEFAFETR